MNGIGQGTVNKYNSGQSLTGEEMGQPTTDEHGTTLAYFKGAPLKKKLENENRVKQKNMKDNLAGEPDSTSTFAKPSFLDPVHAIPSLEAWGQGPPPVSGGYMQPYHDFSSIPFKKKPMDESSIKTMLNGIKIGKK